ncbi:MAG: hypothetical protein ACRCYO_08030 [Bacteroidia bacterium]
MAIQYQFNKIDGYSSAKVEHPFEYAASLLGSDIRNDHSINQILDIIEKLQNGDLEHTVWRQTYNANSLTLTPSNAMIEAMHTDIKPCVIPIDDLTQLLKDWLVFITREVT